MDESKTDYGAFLSIPFILLKKIRGKIRKNGNEKKKSSFPELRGKKFRAFSFWLMLVQICTGKIHRVFIFK